MDSPRSEKNIIQLGDHAIHSFNGARKHYSLVPNEMGHSVAKNYWFWVVAVLIIGAFFLYVPIPGSDKPARLTIKFDDGKVRAFEGPVIENMTVLQALLSASYGGDFDVRYSFNKDGSINLSSINGVANGPKMWNFYLNGEPIRSGDINKVKIKKGDSIEVKYESR